MRALLEGEFFSFNLDANSLTGDFDKPRSQTKSFSSIWEKDVEHHRQESLSLYSLQHLRNLSLMSGSSPKAGTGISSQGATGRCAD